MRFDVNKHIVFRLVSEGRTKVWRVWNTMANCLIGTVKWYSPWRHYCFFPDPDSVFSDRCLVRIGKFVELQNLGHRAG